MTPGIYSVNFRSTTDLGSGIAVIECDRVRGGDASNLYRGRVEGPATALTASIHVSHYQGPPNSIFGPLPAFDLQLTGKETSDGFRLDGHVVGQPQMKISIIGKREAALVD